MKVTFEDAVDLIEGWLQVVNRLTAHRRAIMEDKTVTKPYGWVFQLQHEQFVKERNADFLLYGGHQNILITIRDAAIHVLSYPAGKDAFEHWESTVGARYLMPPEPFDERLSPEEHGHV